MTINLVQALSKPLKRAVLFKSISLDVNFALVHYRVNSSRGP